MRQQHKRNPNYLERASLANIVFRRVRGLDAMKVFYFIVMYGLWVDRHDGAKPTIDELAEELEIPRSSLFRWQKKFREAFPELITPLPIWKQVRDAVVTPDDPETAAMEIGGRIIQVFPEE